MDRDVFDLIVVGTGIHGVHLASSIVEARIVARDRVLLVDPHREFLQLWNRRVHNCCMDFLRSPGSHGLAPNFYDLRRMMRSRRDWIPPYRRPAVSLFHRHARERIRTYLDGLQRVQGTVRTINDTGPFRLVVGPAGETYTSRTVILATGMGAPHVPEALRSVYDRSNRVVHVYDTEFDPLELFRGERVLIAGGGIAALHLAGALARRDLDVTIWTRDRMTVHQFDSDPCFTGPRCGDRFAAIEDDAARLELILANRRPGSVPPDLFERFQRDLQQGIHHQKYIEVKECRLHGTEIEVVGGTRDHETRDVTDRFDRVISCTGFEPGPPARDLLERIARDVDAPLGAGGFPRVDHTLSWLPGLYVTGGLADLALGPPARNIIGAHLARRRVLPQLDAELNR